MSPPVLTMFRHVGFLRNGAVVALFLCVLACEITEPDPIGPVGPSYPPVESATDAGFVAGASVIGTMSIELPSSVDRAGVESYSAWIDTVRLATRQPPDAVLTVDVHSMTEGDHLIILEIMETKPFPGMLGLLGAPNRYIVVPFHASHADLRPPQPITNLSVSWNVHPTLHWTPSPDSLFVAYVIRKRYHANPAVAIVIDSIFDQSASSYADTTELRRVNGLTNAYAVEVTNGYQSVTSPFISASFGTPFPIAGVNFCLERPASNELIVVTDDRTLFAFSMSSNTIVRQASVTPWFTWPSWSITGDGSTILEFGSDLAFSPSDSTLDTLARATVYSASTLSPMGEWTWPATMELPRIPIALEGTTMLVAGLDGTVYFFDAVSGAVLDTLYGAMTNRGGFLATSPDVSQIYALSMEGDAFETTIRRYDRSSGSPVLVQTRTFPRPVVGGNFNPSGSVMVVVHTSSAYEAVELLDPMTLASVGIIQPPAGYSPGSLAYETYVTGDAVYFSYQNQPGHSQVAAHSIPGGAFLRLWDFVGHPHVLRVSPSGEYLYALQSLHIMPTNGWIVPINE